MLKIDHKLGNFALVLQLAPKAEAMDKLALAGMKKMTDGAASKFFVGADGKQLKDRKSLAFSEALGARLASVITEAFKELGEAQCSVAARAWTSDPSAAQLAAKARFDAAMATGKLDRELALSISGWDGKTGLAETAPTESVETEESL